jgi:hypothetical protein
MKKIKLPNPTVMIFGGLGSFWIADIVHPSFNPIGVMVLLLIPVLIIEFLYPKQDLEEKFELLLRAEALKQPVSGELVDETGGKVE